MVEIKKVLAGAGVAAAVVSAAVGGYFVFFNKQTTPEKKKILEVGDTVGVDYHGHKDVQMHLNESLSGDLTLDGKLVKEPWNETLKLVKDKFGDGAVVIPFATGGNQVITDNSTVAYLAHTFGVDPNNTASVSFTHYLNSGKDIKSSTGVAVMAFKDKNGTVTNSQMIYTPQVLKIGDALDNTKPTDNSFSYVFDLSTDAAKHIAGFGSLEAVIKAVPENYTATFQLWKNYVLGKTNQTGNSSVELQNILNGYMNNLGFNAAVTQLDSFADNVNKTFKVNVQPEKNKIANLTVNNYTTDSNAIVNAILAKIDTTGIVGSSLPEAQRELNAFANYTEKAFNVNVTEERGRIAALNENTYKSQSDSIIDNITKKAQTKMNENVAAAGLYEAKRDLTDAATYVTKLGVDVTAEQGRINALTVNNYTTDSVSIIDNMTKKIQNKIDTEKTIAAQNGAEAMHRLYIAKVSDNTGLNYTLLLNKFGGATDDNRTALTHIMEKAGTYYLAWQDSDSKEFLNHQSINWTDMYLNQNDSAWKTLDNMIDDYKEVKGIVYSLDKSDFGSAEKNDTIYWLGQAHSVAPWLVPYLDEKNATSAAKLRNLLTKEGSNLSANFKMAIQKGDVWRMWDSKANGPLMYALDTDSIFEITGKDLQLAQQYLE